MKAEQKLTAAGDAVTVVIESLWRALETIHEEKDPDDAADALAAHLTASRNILSLVIDALEEGEGNV